MQSEPAGVGVSDEEAALAEGNHNRVQEQRDCWEINPSSHKSQMVEIKKMFSAQRAVRRSAFGTEVKQTFF